MKVSSYILIFLNILFCFFGIVLTSSISEKVIIQKKISLIEEKPLEIEIQNNISLHNPSFLDYKKTVEMLKTWNEESPDLTTVNIFGKTKNGQDLYYLRLFNKNFQKVSKKPTVLITACIHGNEPLASSVTMWYIGNLLKRYNEDENIKNLIDSRDIYFVPVVSPDSYPVSRYVEREDPNRNFTDDSKITIVKNLQDLFHKIKPSAVISGHTWGRVFLYPYGDSMEKSPDDKSFLDIVNKMSDLSDYKNMRACEIYLPRGRLNIPRLEKYNVNLPIFGIEIDWYYKNGAFPVIIEFGNHQRIPTRDEIQIEFNKTNEAFIYFLNKAPLVQLKN